MISSIVLSGCGNAGITGGNREELSGGTDKVVSLKAVSHTHLLQVGMYTEMLFPQKGVRFIAINDGVDSAMGDNDFTPLRNLFNEWMVRDTSKKIKFQ